MNDPTGRFSGRAAAYEKTRPTYPRAVLDLLGVGPETTIADLGSGTGIFSRLLLSSGATVYAVEPNAEMRAAAEAELGREPRFHSVAGRAEATALPDRSVDLVTAAQAFHWFDRDAAAREMKRILRPLGRGALIWNDRDTSGTLLLREYDAILIEHCPDYAKLQGKADTPDAFDALFGAGAWKREAIANEQRLDRRGVVDRVLSSSYAPLAGAPGHAALVSALQSLFDRHAVAGEITLRYQCVVISGMLSART
jgi:SAM-dependent methyltransferase